MSPKFKRVKMHYDNGNWNKEMVRIAVVKGWITASEYEKITGEAYEA